MSDEQNPAPAPRHDGGTVDEATVRRIFSEWRAHETVGPSAVATLNQVERSFLAALAAHPPLPQGDEHAEVLAAKDALARAKKKMANCDDCGLNYCHCQAPVKRAEIALATAIAKHGSQQGDEHAGGEDDAAFVERIAHNIFLIDNDDDYDRLIALARQGASK